ncbi:hypothetical protein K438DRAFT_1749461 [Mycena galopus ATCC 62051]|nr:hypothetical protein K438DRAFT_1749461 [Mycena galopus ATCC 62051]
MSVLSKLVVPIVGPRQHNLSSSSSSMLRVLCIPMTQRAAANSEITVRMVHINPALFIGSRPKTSGLTPSAPRKYIKSQDEEEVSNSKRNYPSFRKKRCDYGTRMEIEYLVEEPNLNLKLIPMDIFAIGGYFAPTDWQSTRGYNSSSSFGVSRPVMSSINITR